MNSKSVMLCVVLAAGCSSKRTTPSGDAPDATNGQDGTTDGTTVSCSSNDDCPVDQYCRFAVGICGSQAVCTKRPEACPTIHSPVCGCDNKTYGNECAAAVAGQSVAKTSACGSETCDRLAKTYQDQLKVAKTCCAFCDEETCTTLVNSAIECGCPAYVNGLDNAAALKELEELRDAWHDAGCKATVCPGCRPAVAGRCEADAVGTGICVTD